MGAVLDLLDRLVSGLLRALALRPMTEVLFYHLQEQPIEKGSPQPARALAGARLARRSCKSSSEDRVDALDAHLWTFSDDSFLPHGTDREPTAAEQPILLHGA